MGYVLFSISGWKIYDSNIMIQDILTYIVVATSLALFIRSFIRFFTVRTKMHDAGGGGCGSCDKSCPLKSVMQNIESNALEQTQDASH